MDLGIYGLALPFDNPDKVLMDVIKLKTIKFFSPYQPYKMKIELDLKDLQCLKSLYNESVYVIPDIFGDKRILYISRIDPRSKMLGNGYLSPTMDDSVDTYNMLMLGQANANLLSTMAPPITFKFEAPNIMRLYNFATAYGIVEVEFALEHASNLSTILPTSFESFYTLATYDLKMFLYNTLKHYSEIQTAYGTISLKIDDWANAESDRKDLLSQWKDSFHLDVDQFVII
jgi:hypothetical protein